MDDDELNDKMRRAQERLKGLDNHVADLRKRSVEHDAVSVDTANDDVVGLHGDRLVVDAFSDQHDVAGDCSINRILDGGVVLGNTKCPEWIRIWFGLGLRLLFGFVLDDRTLIGLRVGFVAGLTGLGACLGGTGVGVGIVVVVGAPTTRRRGKRQHEQQSQESAHHNPPKTVQCRE